MCNHFNPIIRYDTIRYDCNTIRVLVLGVIFFVSVLNEYVLHYYMSMSLSFFILIVSYRLLSLSVCVCVSLCLSLNAVVLIVTFTNIVSYVDVDVFAVIAIRIVKRYDIHIVLCRGILRWSWRRFCFVLLQKSLRNRF